MPAIGLLLTLLIVVAGIFGSGEARQVNLQDRAEASAIAGNMLVYRNAVAAFAEANPTQIGTVPDSALALPTWYVKAPYLSHYMQAGKCYVYYTAFVSGLASALAQKTESVAVGINVNGQLSSPNVVTTGIVLPAQVPLSSVVLVQ